MHMTERCKAHTNVSCTEQRPVQSYASIALGQQTCMPGTKQRPQ